MKIYLLHKLVIITIFVALSVYTLKAQDRIYLNRGQILIGKVLEINPREIRYYPGEAGAGPVYVKRITEVDSIVYANGRVDYFRARYIGRNNPIVNYHENISAQNTWSFDVLGFIQLTVAQSFEHRLKDGIVGLRIPVYFGFIGGGIAGVGVFHTSSGVYYPYSSIYNTGGGYYYSNYNNGSSGSNYQTNSTRFSFATGLNPKFYLIRHRIVRPFIGPEADIGYSVINATYNAYDNQGNVTSTSKVYRCGTFAALGKIGLALTPTDRFSLTVDGGVGAGDVFGSGNPVGFTGVWQVGLAFGANF